MSPGVFLAPGLWISELATPSLLQQQQELQDPAWCRFCQLMQLQICMSGSILQSKISVHGWLAVGLLLLTTYVRDEQCTEEAAWR